MPTSWRPVEISSSNSLSSPGEVTYTVVLDGVVDLEEGVEVAIDVSSLEPFSKAPPSSVTVPYGEDRTSFTAELQSAVPIGWTISATCGGVTVTSGS